MRLYISLIFIIIFSGVKAQQTTSYGLYFKDQYMFNPAAAGAKNFAVVTINHRQQWRGIDGAPVTNTFLFHLPVGDKVAMGVFAVNDTRGLLTTNAADLSFAYRIPLSAEDHNIRFGISAGIGMNSLDFTRLDATASQDPAILNSLDNHSYLRGKFGIRYNFKNFSLGAALPSLFKSSTQSPTSFEEISFSPMDEYYAFASVKIPMGSMFDFEPSVAYRGFANGSQYEATAIFHAMKVIWFGGSYRQDVGPVGLFGITVSDRVDFGYAYEMSSNQVSGYTSGTHEIQLSIRVGKKKEPKPKKKKEKEKEPPPPPVIVPVVEEEPVEEKIDEGLIPADSLGVNISKDSILRPIIETEVVEETPIPPQQKDEEIVKRGQHMLELPTGHYVMVGAFGSFENAQEYSDQIFEQGYHGASFGYVSAKKLYYVWITTTGNAENGRSERDRFRKLTTYKDAWYMQVED